MYMYMNPVLILLYFTCMHVCMGGIIFYNYVCIHYILMHVKAIKGFRV